MIKIEDIINRLKILNEEDYIVSLDIEPNITCYEMLSGEGYEETKYTYTITIEQKKPTVREYINRFGVKTYIEKDKESEVK